MTLCRDIRRLTDTPIIISSARGDIGTRLHGLHTGADDYLVKPYDLRELVARVHVQMRRRAGKPPDTRVATRAEVGSDPAPRPESGAAGVSVDQMEIDPTTRAVHAAGAAITLTTKEFDLLALLARAPGVVFSREQMIAEVWGLRTAGADHNLHVHIARLRRKLGDRVLIGTVRSIGYHLGPLAVRRTAHSPESCSW
jgi:DNA-binding response OmpR family regulator